MSSRRIAAPALISLYVAAILCPLALSLLVGKRGDDPFVYQLGLGAGLAGFSLLLMHFVLATRLKWVEQPFGLDTVLLFHRAMGVLSFVLVLGHPLLMAAGRSKWSLLFGLHEHWYIWVGRGALLLLFVQTLLAVFRASLRLEYERWKVFHNTAAVLLLGSGFVHVLFAGGDSKTLGMRVLWSVMFGGAALAYLWHRVARPAQMKHQPYRVTDVRQETRDVWTVSLSPQNGAALPDYLPGQYQYLTLYRDGKPTQEHPFTLSSSPSRPGTVSSTIKASGDFTQTVGETRVGDEAWVDGPYGRFSYVLHPEERKLVFIAGGVGITPLISMLRHICDTQAFRRVLLIYANRTEEDILFQEELAALERNPAHNVRVVHVLSKPGEEWTGEKGHIDKPLLARQCGKAAAGRGFYICGPQGLISGTAACLMDMGVPDRCIHFESFAQ